MEKRFFATFDNDQRHFTIFEKRVGRIDDLIASQITSASMAETLVELLNSLEFCPLPKMLKLAGVE